MNRIPRFGLFISLFFSGLFLLSSAATAQHKNLSLPQWEPDSLAFFDSARGRLVPVALYRSINKVAPARLVILSHGYDANQGGSNKQYSSLAAALARKGYYVASIQHELATDSLLPMTGIPQVVRRTNWERGVVNILFVLKELKRTIPGLDYRHVTLIGHSNGGDMSMLLAQQHPELVYKVISLDNRRVAIPRVTKPKLYSLRSNDQPADEGVLPTAAEQKLYGIKIVKLPATIHNDMDDGGTPEQREEINRYVLGFLKD